MQWLGTHVILKVLLCWRHRETQEDDNCNVGTLICFVSLFYPVMSLHQLKATLKIQASQQQSEWFGSY